MILTIGGIKGGCGKSLLAANLTAIRANEDKKVLLVDGDGQTSSVIWSSIRENQGYKSNWVTIPLNGNSIRNQILKLKNDFQDIIIDCGGTDTVSQRSALSVSDIYLVPFRPRSVDIWTINMVKTLISEIKTINPDIHCYSILNQADSSGQDNSEAADILKDIKELEYLDCPIVNRKSFCHAFSNGLAVFELKGAQQKAIFEMEKLYNILFKKYT